MVPNCYTEHLLSLWYGQELLWPSVWSTEHTTQSAMSIGSVNPPIIAQWIIHTRRAIKRLTQTTLINKSFNFMIILRFKCLIYLYHDNKKLYHITIIGLCNWYITLSILLHITNQNNLLVNTYILSYNE